MTPEQRQDSAQSFLDAIAAIHADYLRNRKEGETADDYIRRVRNRGYFAR